MRQGPDGWKNWSQESGNRLLTDLLGFLANYIQKHKVRKSNSCRQGAYIAVLEKTSEQEVTMSWEMSLWDPSFPYQVFKKILSLLVVLRLLLV